MKNMDYVFDLPGVQVIEDNFDMLYDYIKEVFDPYDLTTNNNDGEWEFIHGFWWDNLSDRGLILDPPNKNQMVFDEYWYYIQWRKKVEDRLRKIKELGL